MDMSVERALETLKREFGERKRKENEWIREREEMKMKILDLEGKSSGQERLIETLLSQLERVSAELSRYKKSAGAKNVTETASFRKRFLTITKRSGTNTQKMSRSLRKSFKPVLRKYMEDLGISPDSLSTRSKYDTSRILKSKSKEAAEASTKRRQNEEGEDNGTMMMDKLDVKTKIAGMKPKDNSSSVPSGLTRTIRWRFVKRSNILCEHLDSVRCLSMEKDTSRLLSGSDDGLVKLWSLKSRSSKTLCTYRGHQGSVFATSFLPYGNMCASAGQDGLIQVWRLPRGNVMKGEQLVQMEMTLRGHQDVIWSLATHDIYSHKLLSGSSDGTIRLWSLKAGVNEEELKIDVPFNGVPVSCAFNPTNAGQCVYGMMDDLSASVSCVDLKTKQSIGSHRFTDGSGDARERMYIYQITPHPKHNDTIISAHEDGRLRVTDFRSGKCEAEIIVSNDDAASCVGIDGSSGGQHLYAGSHNGTVRVFSLGERKMVQDITSAHLKHFDESVNAICYGNGALVTAGSDAVINVYRHVQLK